MKKDVRKKFPQFYPFDKEVASFIYFNYSFYGKNLNLDLSTSPRCFIWKSIMFPDIPSSNYNVSLNYYDEVEEVLDPFVYNYIPLTSFNNNSYMTSIQQTQTTPSDSPVFNSSFRDKFISDYHLKVATEKLTSTSDNTSRLISKKSYDYLYALCNIKYNINPFSKSQVGYEGFIDNHTYISCTYSIKEDLYYLNTIFSNNQELFDTISKELEFVEKPACVSWVTGVCSDGSLDIEILPIEVPKPVYNSFYPWLQGSSVEEFLDNYYKSEESILLLYGNPGTGKSNLLKFLLHKYNDSALITYQDDIRDLDKMFSYFLKSTEKFLIIEDADEFLVKRQNGNTSMKRLLNIADGLTSNKDKKVIFTTNLTNLNSIDPALIREGRCYGTFKFDLLAQEEAKLVAKDLDINPELIVNSTYSLAQLFAIKNNKLKVLKHQNSAPSFGFKK